MRKVKGSGQYQLTEEQCKQMIKNPFVHPVTKETLKIGSDTHNGLMQECSNILKSKDVAHEIMVHITNDKSKVAQDFCVQAVNNVASINEVYDPISQTKREVTSVYSKTLLENCKHTHSVLFLHIQIDDNGLNIFLPCKVKPVDSDTYDVVGIDLIHTIQMISEIIDKWASPGHPVNKATVDALIFGLKQLLATNPINSKYILRLKKREEHEISKLIIRLQYIKNMLATGVQDADRIPQSMKTHLQNKSEKARQKTAYKKKQDKYCGLNSPYVKEYNIPILYYYLMRFNSAKSLDISYQQFYENNPDVDLYQKIALKHVPTNKYIFSEDKQRHHHIDEEWLRKQNEYILSLSTEQIFDIHGYTSSGDELVNTYLRGTFNKTKFMNYVNNIWFSEKNQIAYFPLFFSTLKFINMHYAHSTVTEQRVIQYFTSCSDELKRYIEDLCDATVTRTDKYRIIVDNVAKHISFDSWKTILEMYSQSLENTIHDAPATTQPMYLYRGIKTDYYLQDYMHNRKRIFKHVGFISTSSSISVAYDFTKDIRLDKQSDCCFMRIFIPPGSLILLIAGLSALYGESEFLLSNNCNLYIEKSSTEVFCTNPFSRGYKMRVSDVTLI